MYIQPLPFQSTTFFFFFSDRHPTLLGITMDTQVTFAWHTDRLTAKANGKINTLKALTNTSFGQHKESLKTTFKQFICTAINYSSPGWAATPSDHNIQKLEKNYKAIKFIKHLSPHIHSIHWDHTLCRAWMLPKQSPGLLGTILNRSPLQHRKLKWPNHPRKLVLILPTSEGWQAESTPPGIN